METNKSGVGGRVLSPFADEICSSIEGKEEANQEQDFDQLVPLS
jgi:hypothetical protein